MTAVDGETQTMANRPFVARFGVVVIVVNIVTILLGAFVRASGSGAGCGQSWPTCEGELIPSDLSGATGIEYMHRAVSGVALLAVVALAVVVWRRHPKGDLVRRAGGVAVVAIVGEALIGAAIVLFEWVADDASVARSVAVPLHLVNTLLLLAALTAVVVLADGRRLESQPAVRRVVAVGMGAMVLVAATGAVAALADTLYPSESIASGLVEDFSETSAFLTRLRIVHPVVAIGTGILLILLVSKPDAIRHIRHSRPAGVVVWLVLFQVAAGVANVVLLVPIWIQIVHLLLADLLWMAFVWFGLVALTPHSSEISAS